jgi:hypothetical protein
MELRLAEQVLPVWEIGPDFVTLHTAIEHPPCLGTLWISIDGREHERNVRIPNGMRGDSQEVHIALP